MKNIKLQLYSRKVPRDGINRYIALYMACYYSNGGVLCYNYNHVYDIQVPIIYSP